MAAKSNAQLTADIIAVITGQTTPESITPITHGALEKDIVDSFWNKIDDDLNRTQTFADTATRNAAVPDFVGQNGVQLDTNTYYVSTGLAAGNWQLAANTQIQSDTYGVASGIDTYAVTLTPALVAYTAGNSFKVLFTNANTGASSLQVNGLAAQPITKNGTAPLIVGDIKAGTVYTLTYDGTNFQINTSNNDSGTYVMGGANPVNIFSFSSYVGQWSRVGNVVTVSGKLDIDPNNASPFVVSLELDLPIPSAFAAEENCGGTAFCDDTVQQGAAIKANVGSGRAIIIFYCTTNSAMSFFLNFTYQII